MNKKQMEENYQSVLCNIENACQRSGRNPEDITLIAVSKTKPVETVKMAIDIGMTEFGENKPQEIRDKTNEISTPVKWHMIGHLQSNKIKYVLTTCELIHSIDSLKLAQQLNEQAIKKECHVNILLQVNISKETSKQGFLAENLEQAVREIRAMSHLHIQGFMTIAPYVENPEDNRHLFRQLNELLIDIKSKNIDNVNMNILSMGMTGDYEVAIEEGATHIRVGTGLFGERNYNK